MPFSITFYPLQINYGIFPGTAAVNLLLSRCLKEDKVEYAARIAAYAMLQELHLDRCALVKILYENTFECSEITNHLSLLAAARWAEANIKPKEEVEVCLYDK